MNALTYDDIWSALSETTRKRVSADDVVKILDACNAKLAGNMTAAKSALENYGRHFSYCQFNGAGVCNCGFHREMANMIQPLGFALGFV